jgi:type IV secretory pathway TrbD component
MATLNRKVTPKALNKPLTLFGMDYKVLGGAFPVLAVVGGAGNCWQATVAGAALFLLICAAGRYATRKDPNYLRYALRQLWRKALYDPLKREPFQILVLLPRKAHG